MTEYTDDEISKHSEYIAHRGYDDYVRTCKELGLTPALEQGDVTFETWVNEQYPTICMQYFEIALTEDERAEYLWQQYLARDLEDGE